MTVRRYFATTALITTVAASGFVAGTSPAYAGGTGKAVLHLVDPDGTPVPGFTVCPTQKRGPDTGKKEGKCDTSDKHGYVTLKKVKPGKWFLTYYVNDEPQGSFLKKFKVVAGQTTHKKYVVAG